jgi:hypothetical protein
MYASASSAGSKGSASHTVAKKRGLLATTRCVGTMSRVRPLLIMSVPLLWVSVASHAADVPAVVDTILGKYKNAGTAWEGTVKQVATSIFWILATISLSSAGVSAAAAESNKLLLDRIAAAEAAIAAGNGNGNIGSANTITRQDPNAADARAGVTGAGRNPGTDTGASHRPTTASNTSRVPVSPAGEKKSTGPTPAGSSQAEEPDEPPLTRPMTPDEQRGFPPPTDPPGWQK